MNMKELTKVSKFLQELKLGPGLKLDADTNTVSVPTMVGATESTSGVAGLVPPATPEEAEKVLLGNGTWGLVNRPDINASIGCKVFHFAANERDAVLPSGSLLTVPEYSVGSNAIHVYLDNGRCFIGQQYEEVGTAPALSTQIKILFDLEVYHDLQGFVITAVIDPEDPSALQRIIALEERMVDCDGVTTSSVDKKIVAKDLAVGGDASDLVSARGFFYDDVAPWYAGTPGDTYLISDFNEFTRPGVYHIRWREGSEAEDADGRQIPVTANNPNAGEGAGQWFDGLLTVTAVSSCSTVSTKTRIQQHILTTTDINKTLGFEYVRAQTQNLSTLWSTWSQVVTTGILGNGLTFANRTLSVANMTGATEAKAGTAGLVPAPAADDQDKVLSGAGTWVQAVEVDGVTTSFDTSGKIKAQNIAIGGNASDLASTRGQIGDYVSGGFFDFSTEIQDTKNIFYGSSESTNKPFNAGPFSLQVKSRGYSVYKWISYFVQSCGHTAAPQAAIKSTYTTDGGATYSTAGWSILLDEKHIGDGIVSSNGIISVPEYEGATASAAGTSGLVPPALKTDLEKVLWAGGEWKSAIQSPSETTSGWVNYEPVYTSGQNAHAAPSEGWVQVVAEAKGAATPYLSLCSYKSTTPDSVITDTSSDKWDYELLSESTHILSNRGRLNLRVAKGTKFNLWFTDEANITIKMYRFIPCKSSV